MISRRSSSRNALQPMRDINVVPYIDVMLVLLIIFMITAPLMNVGQIELPTIGKSAAPPAVPLEVIIRRDTTLALRDRSNSDREITVTSKKLIEIIRQKQVQNANQPVVISADREVRYEAVVEVMDMLQQQKIKKIGLLAHIKSP